MQALLGRRDGERRVLRRHRHADRRVVRAALGGARRRGGLRRDATDSVEYLVALPAQTLLTLSLDLAAADTDRAWALPVVDGAELAAPPVTLAQRGTLAPVALLAGGTTEDISAFAAPASCSIGAGSASPSAVTAESAATASSYTRGDFLGAAIDFGFDDAEAERLAELYSLDAPRPGAGATERWAWAIVHAGADGWANCVSRRLLRWAADRGERSLYWYRWSFVPQVTNGVARTRPPLSSQILCC